MNQYLNYKKCRASRATQKDPVKGRGVGATRKTTEIRNQKSRRNARKKFSIAKQMMNGHVPSAARHGTKKVMINRSSVGMRPEIPSPVFKHPISSIGILVYQVT